jgi:DNA-binding NarL/FixJ family response regulator
MNSYYRVPVQNVSIETLSEAGYEIGDNGRETDAMIGLGQSEFIMKQLPRRQREVIDCICQGYSRREIAEKLGISLQAIHQIIPRKS